jgi:HEAT repeat protein
MSRHSIFLAGGLATTVFGVILLVYGFSGALQRAPAVDISAPLGELEARLDRLERQLETRLRETETEGSLSSDHTGREILAADREDLEGSASDAEETEETGSPDGDLEGVLARLDDLDTRLRGLEVDPIERGYAYLESRNSELRRQGIFTLERIAQHDPEARAAIRQMLADPDARVRLASLDTLADLGDKESAAQITNLLGDPEASVRREAITSLARLDYREGGMAIAELISDPDRETRERAADAMGKLKFKEGMNLLVGALADPSQEVRGEAIASLGEVGNPAVVPQLRRIYEQDPGQHRFRLVMALKNLGDTQPFQQEVTRLSGTALNDQSEYARSRAIRTLSWFARDASRDVFKKALEDSSSRVRHEAQRALQGRGR